MSDFVSGLAGPVKHDAVVDPAGAALLLRIRLIGRTFADELAPRCVVRFDGVERTEPVPSDLEEKAVYEGIVALVDAVRSDPEMLRKVAAVLGKRGGR